MAGVWKRDGTVAVTNGNKKVTGTGTTFADTKNGVAKGHLFCITSGTSVDFYEVDYVVSNTELYLVQAYRGVTATGKAYEIITTFSDSVPEFARRLTATLSAYQQQSDAFQALLTSTAATVEVTSPDGTKQTLIPWKRVTSEGEGQAARAKSEADKAAASAALAGDIVAASALPLPDVWAPLSDSLRLITGYGRDVLVGSDVVARMVNFSRSSTATYIGKDGQLKTAAANEPRFEKEGLLVEGQSTNLIPTSNFPQNLAGWIAPNSSGNTHAYGLAPDGSNTAMKVAFAGDGLNRGIPELTDGVTYTFSFYAKNENATAVEFLIRIGGSTGSVVFQVPGNTPWRRYQVTQTYKEGDRSLRWYVNTKNVEIWLWGAQIEALPFASSYIPTNGAAATRTADVVTIPWALNVRPSNVTVALNYDVLGIGLTNQRLIEYAAPTIPRYLMQVTQVGDFETYCATQALKVVGPSIGPGSLAVASTSPTRHALKLTGKAIAVATPAGPVGATSDIRIGSGQAGASPTYGHIRNLRIWHSTLTDDQLKAVA
ncbi:phage head spike fiber domain-containing protein [Aeromonas rivipollensis]|uniref:phage head spike fiber domain-containing protein n=1 Tax=Aeromonas rivipollensis TaxID=948519 RepID=UPI003D21CF8D